MAKSRRTRCILMISSSRLCIVLTLFQGEFELGNMSDMNPFVASIILSQVTLGDFLDKSPEARMQEHASLIGHKRMVRITVVLQ